MELLTFETPFGRMGLLGAGDAVSGLILPGRPTPRIAERETPVLTEARSQLQEYLAGRLKSFSLPLAPEGTPFQMRVWAALEDIPWGETRSYGALAACLGAPGAARAVGGACRRNPIPILIPCHRAVGADGSLTGFAGGLGLKRSLLTLEGGRIT